MVEDGLSEVLESDDASSVGSLDSYTESQAGSIAGSIAHSQAGSQASRAGGGGSKPGTAGGGDGAGLSRLAALAVFNAPGSFSAVPLVSCQLLELSWRFAGDTPQGSTPVLVGSTQVLATFG